MGVWSGFKRVVKPMVDVKRWSDASRIKEDGVSILETAKKLLLPQKSQNAEDFEQACRRLNLDETDLKHLSWKFLLTSIFFLIFSGVAVGYLVYIIESGASHTILVAVVTVLLGLTLSFRYHFWYFQIKHRKLGCSFKEWLYSGLLRK